jgi:hypothetical protein
MSRRVSVIWYTAFLKPSRDMGKLTNHRSMLTVKSLEANCPFTSFDYPIMPMPITLISRKTANSGNPNATGPFGDHKKAPFLTLFWQRVWIMMGITARIHDSDFKSGQFLGPFSPLFLLPANWVCHWLVLSIYQLYLLDWYWWFHPMILGDTHLIHWRVLETLVESIAPVLRSPNTGALLLIAILDLFPWVNPYIVNHSTVEFYIVVNFPPTWGYLKIGQDAPQFVDHHFPY